MINSSNVTVSKKSQCISVYYKYLPDVAIANAYIISQYIPSERTAKSFLKVMTLLA